MQENLLSQKKIAKNIFWNFFGTLLPGILVLACIPLSIKNLGDDRFGLLSIAWGLLGYLSLLDFGMSRSLTHSVASKISTGDHDKINADISTTMVLLVSIGSVLSLVLFATENLWISSIFKTEAISEQELKLAVNWILIGIPITLASVGQKGALEAFGRFDVTNIIRIPLSFATYGLPAVISYFTKRIDIGIMFITASRIIGLIGYHYYLKKMCLGLKIWIFDKVAAKQLWRFGGWLAVSNVISPMMHQLDRLLIGATIGIAGITFYSTPIEILTKLWLVQGAVMSVMFPSLISSNKSAPEKTPVLYRTSLHLILLFAVPCVFLSILFSNEIVSHWINPEFASKTDLLFKVIAFGVLANAIAHVPFGLIQSWGRSDVTAKFHLIQLPIYLVFFYWLVGLYGILGAAFVWTGRLVLDAVMLSLYAKKKAAWTTTMSYLLILSIISVGLIFVSPLLGLYSKALLTIGSAITFTTFFYFSRFFSLEKKYFSEIYRKLKGNAV